MEDYEDDFEDYDDDFEDASLYNQPVYRSCSLMAEPAPRRMSRTSFVSDVTLDSNASSSNTTETSSEILTASA